MECFISRILLLGFFYTFRKLAGDAIAGVIIAFVVVTVGGTYARLFMPEAMQLATVSLSICAFYQLAMRPLLVHALVLGITLGLGILIKVHVFLLIPCFLVGMCLIGYVHRLSLLALGKLCVAFLFATLVTAYVFRFLISGQHSLNLLGTFYGDIAEQNGATWERVPQYIYVLKHHVATLLLVFSPVIATALAAMLGIRRHATALNALRCTIFTVAIATVGMLLISVVFTVSVSGSGPYESVDRIHGRYYEHLFILLAALVALRATAFYSEIGRLLRWGIFVFTGVALYLSYISTKHLGWQNPTDFAVTFGLYSIPHVRLIALMLGFTALVLMFIRPAISRLVVILGLIVALTFSAYECDKLITNLPIADADRAAILIATAMSNTHNKKVVIASPQADADFYRAAFHLIKYNPTLLAQPSLADDHVACPIDTTTAEWLLVVSSKSTLACKDFFELIRFNDSTVYTRLISPAPP